MGREGGARKNYGKNECHSLQIEESSHTRTAHAATEKHRLPSIHIVPHHSTQAPKGLRAAFAVLAVSFYYAFFSCSENMRGVTA